MVEAVVFLLLPLALAPAFASGRVTEKVVCREAPDQSYALYLPSSYDTSRRWPVLYLLDARGRALQPIERFRDAAQQRGWVLVSSYNSRSDTAGDPNSPAMRAMRQDAHERLALDPRREYVTGFSGGARAAVGMALSQPEAFAGVIGCGAGFPGSVALPAKIPFPYFGAIGNRDFNYYEMRELEEGLARVQATFRIEFFDGAHDWPPPEVAHEALEWMDLQALRSGASPRDEARVRALYDRDAARASALESSGREIAALRLWAAIARDYAGLSEITQAASRAATLEGSPRVQEALAAARRRDERDRAALASLERKLAAALAFETPPPPAKVANDLGVRALKRRATGTNLEDGLSAARLLASLRVQTAFYLPEQYLERGDTARARLLLGVAAEIEPEDPWIDYSLASVAARLGDRRRAIQELESAIAKGFRRFELLDGDPDFAKLREDSEFRQWLDRARSAPPVD